MIYDISAGRQKGGAAPVGRGNAPSLHLALSHIYENISEHIKSVRKFPQCCKSRENSRCQSCHGQARVARWAGSWESWERCLTGDKTQHVKCPLIVACNLLQWQSLVVQIRDNPGRTGNMAAKCNASEHAHTLIRLARLPISLWLQWVQPMHSIYCKYTANILHIYCIYTTYILHICRSEFTTDLTLENCYKQLFVWGVLNLLWFAWFMTLITKCWQDLSIVCQRS